MDNKKIIKLLCNPIEEGFWVLEAVIDLENSPIAKLLGKNISSKEKFRMEYEISNKLEEFILEKFREGAKEEFQKFKKILENSKLVEDKKRESSYKEGYEKFEVEDDYLKTFIPLERKDNGYYFVESRVFYSISKIRVFSLERSFRGELKIISYDEETIKKLKQYVEKFDPTKIEIKKNYFNEKDSFLNYPYLLHRINLRSLTENFEIIENIEQALQEIYSGKPDNAARFCGLAMEALIREIYITCIRQIPPDTSLGVMLRDFKNEIKRIQRVDNKKEDKTTESLELEKRIKKLEEKIDNKDPFFPRRLSEAIDQTVKYRNSSEHSSSEEIDNFRIALCLRGVIYLFLWWKSSQNKIKEWDRDKKQIIKELKKEEEVSIEIKFIKLQETENNNP